MLESNRRGTLVLYLILALLISLLIITGAAAPPVGAVLLVAYFAMLFVTSRPWRLPESLPEMRQQPVRVTNAAQLAAERTLPVSPLSSSALFQMQDVGLIIDERRRDGVMLRHARFITMDEESLRPYVVLHAPPRSQPRQVLVRFEIADTAGNPEFVCEMDYVLRSGENLVLPDYRLRLKGNEQAIRSGNYDLNISVNGNSVGIHRFNLLPSLEERRRQAGSDGEVPSRLIQEVNNDPLPVSLEELLGRQRRS